MTMTKSTGTLCIHGTSAISNWTILQLCLLQPQTDALLGNERDEALAPVLTAGWLSAVRRKHNEGMSATARTGNNWSGRRTGRK